MLQLDVRHSPRGPSGEAGALVGYKHCHTVDYYIILVLLSFLMTSERADRISREIPSVELIPLLSRFNSAVIPLLIPLLFPLSVSR